MNSQIHKHLPALFALAHDRSEHGRLALADKLTEIFLSQSAALTENEEKLVYELIEDLLKNESLSVREALISRFEKAANAPRPVALRIVNGPAEIARSVLISNEYLSDEDLVSIVETKSADHAAAVAERKKISEAVADALVKTGDLRVMQVVAENMGAKLSSRALDIMVDAARAAAMLQKPLLERQELGPEAAIRLYWWTAQDLRRAALERFGFGPGRLDMALKKAIEEKLSAHELQRENPDEVEKLANWLEERHSLEGSLLPRLLRAGYYRLANTILSRLAKVSQEIVGILTEAANGRLLVVLCRAIGIEKGHFVSIFLMARGEHLDEQIVHPRELSSALMAFDKLDPEMARKMLDGWRKDPDSLKAKAKELAAQKETT